jgi:hypothetical protein
MLRYCWDKIAVANGKVEIVFSINSAKTKLGHNSIKLRVEGYVIGEI